MKRQIITFRVSERERREIDEIAGREGLTVSDLIRRGLGLAIRSEARAVPSVEGAPDPATEPGAAALQQLRRRLGQN